MAISKVIYKSSAQDSGTVWMDATTATATAADIIAPLTAMLANGVVTVGTGSGGGGGLEYEEGTVIPSSDISRLTISYTNTHNAPASFAGIYDMTNDSAVSGSCVFWQATNIVGIAGVPVYSSASSIYRAYFIYGFKSSDTAISTTNVMLNDCADWTTTNGFLAYCQSSNRYWRSGRTYKWIAVWVSTT